MPGRFRSTYDYHHARMGIQDRMMDNCTDNHDVMKKILIHFAANRQVHQPGDGDVPLERFKGTTSVNFAEIYDEAKEIIEAQAQAKQQFQMPQQPQQQIQRPTVQQYVQQNPFGITTQQRGEEAYAQSYAELMNQNKMTRTAPQRNVQEPYNKKGKQKASNKQQNIQVDGNGQVNISIQDLQELLSKRK